MIALTTAAWVAASFAMIHLGDSSLAAIIAAGASIGNALILLRAHGVQSEIKKDIKDVANDTRTRGQQIEELRSLSIERERQILRLERLADRFKAALDDNAN